MKITIQIESQEENLFLGTEAFSFGMEYKERNFRNNKPGKENSVVRRKESLNSVYLFEAHHIQNTIIVNIKKENKNDI